MRTIFDAINEKSGNSTGEERFKPKPCKPVRFWPGTSGKVQAMVERVNKGQELWHKDDPGNPLNS